MFCWYDAGCDKTGIKEYSKVTSTEFGTGKTNTETMMTAWNKGTEKGEYGERDANGIYKDMWGIIQYKIEDGWFVPSKGEWCAFAEAFKIKSSNYSGVYQLKTHYWSSSLDSSFCAWYSFFASGYMVNSFLSYCAYVRLAIIY